MQNAVLSTLIELPFVIKIFILSIFEWPLKTGVYGKCSKILNTFLFQFLKEMLVIRAGIHKKHVGIANREDPDQTASSEAV